MLYKIMNNFYKCVFIYFYFIGATQFILVLRFDCNKIMIADSAV